MKRRFNFGLFLVLLGGFVLLGVGAFFLHRYQVKRTAGLLLNRATAAEEKVQYSQAVSYFGRYLALVPSDSEAMAKYGFLLANDKVAVNPRSMRNAYFVLDRALFLDNQRHDIRR